MNLKNQLQHYLRIRGMTPSQLSRLANVPRQNISNWLMNQKPKDVEQVKRVADVFQVTIDHLLFGDPTPIKTDSDTLTFEHVLRGRFEIKIKKIEP